MLPKQRRISRKLFPLILSTGRRHNSPHLLFYCAPIENGTEKPSQFSFSASKKVAKLATDRNRLRRRGYSIITPLLPRIRPGYLCFFSFKKGSGTISFEVLEQEVATLLSQANLL